MGSLLWELLPGADPRPGPHPSCGAALPSHSLSVTYINVEKNNI